jgi:hypothetical protein
LTTCVFKCGQTDQFLPLSWIEVSLPLCWHKVTTVARSTSLELNHVTRLDHCYVIEFDLQVLFGHGVCSSA